MYMYSIFMWLENILAVDCGVQASRSAAGLRQLQPSRDLHEEAARVGRVGVRRIRHQRHSKQGPLPHDRFDLQSRLDAAALDGPCAFTACQIFMVVFPGMGNLWNAFSLFQANFGGIRTDNSALSAEQTTGKENEPEDGRKRKKRKVKVIEDDDEDIADQSADENENENKELSSDVDETEVTS